jgi:hypothetical protein
VDICINFTIRKYPDIITVGNPNVELPSVCVTCRLWIYGLYSSENLIMRAAPSAEIRGRESAEY